MPLALQAKILRVLQEQAFERVGGNETVRTDVRLIAATHRDLKAWSAEGKFRPDLYYRLSVFTIHLPPLRERGDDLPLLVQHYLRRFSRELGREVREVAPEAMERLRGYSWPGNIRELQSVLKQALLQASGTVLLPDFLPADLFRETRRARPARHGPSFRPGMTLAELEREAIQQCLIQTGGNRQRTAELLGISTRTLLRKIREYGLGGSLEAAGSRRSTTSRRQTLTEHLPSTAVPHGDRLSPMAGRWTFCPGLDAAGRLWNRNRRSRRHRHKSHLANGLITDSGWGGYGTGWSGMPLVYSGGLPTERPAKGSRACRSAIERGA